MADQLTTVQVRTDLAHALNAFASALSTTSDDVAEPEEPAPKVHACSCGKTFASPQGLGGHRSKTGHTKTDSARTEWCQYHPARLSAEFVAGMPLCKPCANDAKG